MHIQTNDVIISRLQQKNLNKLGLLKRKKLSQCHSESNRQVCRSRPCQKEKKQNRQSRVPDRVGERIKVGKSLINFFDTQVSSISIEKLVLPRHAHCVLSCLRCNGHGFLLSSYLSRIGRIENPSCSACEHSSQDASYLIMHYPATDSLRCLLFGDSLSLYDLWSRPWRVARLLRLHTLSLCLHPS